MYVYVCISHRLLLFYSTSSEYCVWLLVSEGNNKSGPSAAFFADLEQRCPNLRSLDLSYVDLRAPLPASVEFLALGESWLSPSGWPASRFDAESQTVTLPRLREVELVGVKLRKGAMAALPSSVERLWILDTRLPQSCFQSDPVNQGVVSPSRLAELDFSYSNSTAPEIRQATTAWPHVTTLKLDECFYIPFTQFVTNLDRLEVLEANELLTSLTDFNVCVICDNLGGTLRRLGIAGSQLSVIGAWLIAEKLTHLESLEVSGCRQLPPVTFFMFANLRGTLRSLNISDTNVDSGTVDVLKSCMPACNIVN